MEKIWNCPGVSRSSPDQRPLLLILARGAIRIAGVIDHPPGGDGQLAWGGLCFLDRSPASTRRRVRKIGPTQAKNSGGKM